MSPETVRRLNDLFSAMQVLVGGPVSSGETDAAEERVGVKFPPDYREFIACFGGAVVGSLPVLGLRQAEVMGDDSFSVVDVTSRFRADGWKPTEASTVISIDLSGNPIGLTRVPRRA